MNTSAVDKMKQAINFAQKAWNDASKQFDAGSASLELKAGRSIDLFGGAVTRQVAELAQESRNLCDELYATCQTQIRILDETCRPLLDDNTDFSLVRDVWTLIKKLNEESEITNNFTASLNQHNLGDVATVQYFPSME